MEDLQIHSLAEKYEIKHMVLGETNVCWDKNVSSLLPHQPRIIFCNDTLQSLPSRSFPGTRGAGGTKWSITTAELWCFICWETWTETFLMLEMLPAALAFSSCHVKIRLQRKQQRWMGWVFSSNARCFLIKWGRVRTSYCTWWKEWGDNWKKSDGVI